MSGLEEPEGILVSSPNCLYRNAQYNMQMEFLCLHQ